MVVTRRVEPAERASWDAFVAANPEADVLQSWAWGEAWAPEGERPVRIVLADGSDRWRAIAQLLVRQTSAGRSVVYVPHGPVWRRSDPDAEPVLVAMLEGIADVARQERAIVVKLDPRVGPDAGGEDFAELARRSGLVRARRDLQAPTTRIVDLRDGGPELAATWHKDERNRVRRAAREGVTATVERDGAAEAVEVFATLLRATAERDGFRARSVGFLGRLAAELAPGGGWFLTLAHHQGRPIAGIVTPRIGDRAYYLYGASLREAGLEHAFGSDAAMAAAMAALAADGVRTLDLWGVAEPDDPDADRSWAGFSLFKRRFGGAALRHPGTFDLVVDRPLYLVRDARERLADAMGRR